MIELSDCGKSTTTKPLITHETWLCESSFGRVRLWQKYYNYKIVEGLDCENFESVFLNQSTLSENLWSKFEVNANDASSRTFCATYAHVEEPWSLQACTSCPSFDAEQSDNKDEEAQPSLSDQLEQLAQPSSSN